MRFTSLFAANPQRLRRVYRLQALAAILLFAVAASTAVGGVDPSFSVAISEGAGFVRKTIAQPDGKLIAIGSFIKANGTPLRGVARYNPDGSRDTDFNAGGTGTNGDVLAVALQADGKILIGGSFSTYNGQPTRCVIRLNQDGTLDPAYFFALEFSLTFFSIRDIAIDNDGKALVVGHSFLPRGNDPFHAQIFRMRTDGSVDPGFNLVGDGASAGIETVIPLPDGDILIGGAFHNYAQLPARLMARLSKEGELQQSFQVGNQLFGEDVQRIIVEPNGDLLICGRFANVQGAATDGLARLAPDGQLITTFEINPDPESDIVVNDMVRQADGKIIVGADEVDLNENSRVVRFTPSGDLDNTFNNGDPGPYGVLDFLPMPDGQIVVSGEFLSYNENARIRFAKIDENGNLATGFSPSASTVGTVFAVRAQPDGKIVFGGDFEYVNGVRTGPVARVSASGSLDNTFHLGSGLTGDIFALLVEQSGKIAIGGKFYGDQTFPALMAARLNSDGSFAHKLNFANPSPNLINSIAAQADGKLILAGQLIEPFQSTTRGVAAIRVNPDGSLDSTFARAIIPNYTVVRTVLIRPDDDIIIGGNFLYQSAGGINRSGLARLNSNGTLDDTFGVNIGSAWGLTSDPASGHIYGCSSAIRKYDAQGNADPTFFVGEGTNAPIRTCAVQADHKVLYGGDFTSQNGQQKNYLGRVDSQGAVDPTFDVGTGPAGPVYALAPEPDGGGVVGGRFSSFDGAAAESLVRLLPDSAPASAAFDYDGDARSDISVFRPADGSWYLNRSTAGFQGLQFGAGTDKIAPADYDGDGKTDVAVYRPSDGVWFIVKSSNGTVEYRVFGLSEDLPAPADYDGDGKADICVFRPSTGTWYRQNSSNGTFFGIQFGLDGDRPTVGDFDGDSKADIGIWRPSNGDWYHIRSSNGSVFGERFGISTDKMVPADYDGDGKTDIAVWRPSSGVWYIKQSSNDAYVSFLFGLATDIPAPGDFDGDGKTDRAVFRPSDGTWYIANSTNGTFTILPWGQSGDRPTPAAFLN